MAVKQCDKCNKTLDIGNFYKNVTKADGVHPTCKACKKFYNAQWYKKNAAKVRKSAKLRLVALKKRRKQWLLEYLQTHPCVDCGESNPVVLDFDHVRGVKVFTIAKCFLNVSWNSLMLEVEKCDIRCANCHRIKTAKQHNWFKHSQGSDS